MQIQWEGVEGRISPFYHVGVLMAHACLHTLCWMKNGPAGSLYSVSDSGWMESANTKLFIPAVKSRTTALPVDGQNTSYIHVSLQLIERQVHIAFI